MNVTFETNNFFNNTTEHYNLVEEGNSQITKKWLPPLLLFYSLIFIVGISGNILAIVAVLRSRRLRKHVTNIFICNLAVSDIALCLFTIPFTPLSAFLSYWPLGGFLCRVLPIFQGEK